MLPKTEIEIENGGVYEQAVKCGKETCRCRNGELHRGYYYFIWRHNGRQRKRYVAREKAESLIATVEAARARRRQVRGERQKSLGTIAEMRSKLKELAIQSNKERASGEK